MFEIVTKWTGFILLLTSMPFVNGMDNSVIALLNSIVEHEAEPTNVFIKSCWPLHIETDILRRGTMQMVFINDFMYKLPIDLSPSDVLFVTNLDCYGTDEFFAGVNVNQTFFKHPYRWIMFTSSNLTDVKAVEQLNNALPDSNIILAKWNDQDNSFDLSQFYKTGPFTETIYESFGYWSTTNGLVDLRKDTILSQRRRNLRSETLRSSFVILQNDSINHLTDYRDRSIDSVTKVCYVVWNLVLDCMNSSKNLTFADTWGYIDIKTNITNGMFGALLYNDTDIGGTPAFMTEERVGVYEFVAMGVPTRTKFIFRAPTLSFVTNIYYLPFEANVWYSLVALVIVSCVIVYYTHRVSNMRSPTEEVLRASDIFLFGISSICQMSAHRDPRYASGKISTIVFIVALIFVYTSYTANIVSLLQSTTKSIKTLEDLHNSDLGFGVEDTPYNRNYFAMTRPGTIQRKIYERKIVPPKQPSKFMNSSYGGRLMRNGFFAFHTEGGTAYKIIEDTFFEHEKCGLVEIDYLAVIDPWLAIRKHLPYKEMIKVLLMRIREHGILAREVSRIYSKRPVCSSHGQSFESVRLIDCQIVLKILACGFIFSFFIFIIEKIVHARSLESKLCLL